MMLVVATLLASALLNNSGQSAFFVRSKFLSLQSLHAQESAVRLAAYNLLKSDSTKKVFDFALPVVSIDSSDYWIRLSVNQGGFAELGRSKTPDLFAYAIRILNSPDQKVLVTSEKIISAFDEVVARQNSLQNHLFSNTIHPDSTYAYTDGVYNGNTRIYNVKEILELDTIRVLQGDLKMELGHRGNKSELLAGNKVLAVQGNVEIAGFVDIDTLKIFCNGNVRIQGEVTAKKLQIFAKGKIDIEDQFIGQVRLLATGDISILDESQLLPWSFVVSLGGGNAENIGFGRIRIDNSALVSGYVLGLGNTDSTSISVDRRARFYGYAASKGKLINDGFIGGVTLAKEVTGNGYFELDSLPKTLAQIPLMNFSDTFQWVPVQWNFTQGRVK